MRLQPDSLNKQEVRIDFSTENPCPECFSEMEQGVESERFKYYALIVCPTISTVTDQT